VCKNDITRLATSYSFDIIDFTRPESSAEKFANRKFRRTHHSGWGIRDNFEREPWESVHLSTGFPPSFRGNTAVATGEQMDQRMTKDELDEISESFIGWPTCQLEANFNVTRFLN